MDLQTVNNAAGGDDAAVRDVSEWIVRSVRGMVRTRFGSNYDLDGLMSIGIEAAWRAVPKCRIDGAAPSTFLIAFVAGNAILNELARRRRLVGVLDSIRESNAGRFSSVAYHHGYPELINAVVRQAQRDFGVGSTKALIIEYRTEGYDLAAIGSRLDPRRGKATVCRELRLLRPWVDGTIRWLATSLVTSPKFGLVADPNAAT